MLAQAYARRAQVKDDLSDPDLVEHVTREVRRRLCAGRPKAANPARIAQLESEIDNLVNALATGALRSSPALASRLAAAEAELARLKERAAERVPIERLIPHIGERYRALVRELERTAERDPQRAHQALSEALEEAITLHPENGVLLAEIAYRAPLPLAGNVAEFVVAGGRFAHSLACHFATA